MNKKQVLVNAIQEDNGLTFGIVSDTYTTAENLSKMYSREVMVEVNNQIRAAGQTEAYFFDRYCQFIIQFQFIAPITLLMKVWDLHDSTDVALDNYLMQAKDNWKKEDRGKVMALFQKIQNDPNKEMAEMILKDGV